MLKQKKKTINYTSQINDLNQKIDKLTSEYIIITDLKKREAIEKEIRVLIDYKITLEKESRCFNVKNK